jgi:arsenate reductase
MQALNLPNSVQLREIKSEPLTASELDALYNLSGSYESLFSKRARLYKERNLKESGLQENDFRSLILEHYTFLKRPVFVYNGEIFIGNSKKTVESASKAVHQN